MSRIGFEPTVHGPASEGEVRWPTVR